LRCGASSGLAHCQQGGLCVLLGEPGTGKTVLKNAITHHNQKEWITPVINRSLHTWHNMLRLLCGAFELARLLRHPQHHLHGAQAIAGRPAVDTRLDPLPGRARRIARAVPEELNSYELFFIKFLGT